MESTTETARGRDEQILSAKKKLKNYRSKQAKVARSQSSFSLSREAKPSVDIASPIAAELILQTEENSRRHSRGASRGGHGRRHSRSGSISITSKLLISPSAIASGSTSAQRPGSAFPASTGHLRTHSRSNSRTIIGRSRPNSFMHLGNRKPEPTVLAVEHPAGVNPLGEWNDISDHNANKDVTAGQPQVFGDSSTLFASPGRKHLSGCSPAKENASITPSPSATTTHARRVSRHARCTSVATKRESMEIMGGLGLGIVPSQSNESIASSRRRSSRMSGLPSASILFGVTELTPEKASSANPWDWRAAFSASSEEQDDEQGRLTALEKLEGRCQSQSADAALGQSQPSPSAVHSLHQRHNSVQLPSFDDVHGAEGMKKRASLRLLESNENTTSEGSQSASRESWRGGLAPPPSASSLSNTPTSPNAPTFIASPKRPESIIVHTEAPQPEGLGTLLEEEEEEESMSPVHERQSMDMPLSGSTDTDEDQRRQRRLAEEETIRRNRRASLTPRPLKLKSRPPSLYLTPAGRTGLSANSSLPTLSTSNPSSPTTSQQGDITPKMSTVSLAPEPTKASNADSMWAQRSPGLARECSFANAQEKAAKAVQESAPSEDSSSYDSTTHRPEIIQAYRTSMMAASPDAPMPHSAPSSQQRQGMRTLRLGSQTSLASMASITESTSSSSSSSSANLPPSAPLPSTSSKAHKRLSLVTSGSGSISLTREELGNGTPTSATIRNMRRSSIHYKPASPAMGSGSDGPFGHSASSSLASFGGVPVAVHDELKAKASKDAALLESAKQQIGRLQRELAVESKRSAREYAELERWSAEEKRLLSSRIESIERTAGKNSEEITMLKLQLEEAKEQMEDLEAERDVLSDDVEGWRSRCQDLEKSLRSERTKLDDQRRLKSAAKLRIQKLTEALEQNGVQVPEDELNVCQALEKLQLDTSVLRSPALSSSPVLGGGYFSPVLGNDAPPPPQAIKLLADMRQQIFNLAGSLEHERSEHLKAKDELLRLHEENQQMLANTSYAMSEAADESRDASMTGGKRASRSNSVVGKNKRHVFAYDSSMGSFGQSSASLGSASMSMTTEDMTVDVDDDTCLTSPPSKAPFIDAEVGGLSMGGLQILDEVEEVSESGDGSAAATSEDEKHTVDLESRWTDIEAGEVDTRTSMDISESSFGEAATFEDAKDLEVHHETFSSPLPSPVPVLTVEGRIIDSKSNSEHSSGSSLESNEMPSTPPLDHHHDQYLHDDASTVSSQAPSPRPEFIPNWNFDMAIRRGRLSRGKKGHAKHDSIEDFFGIMQDNVLPPLSTSEEPVDMPPIAVHSFTGVQSAPGAWPKVSTRTASIVGRRPPVARSAYTRESVSSGPVAHVGSNSFSATSSAAALGSRALSRMSLQGFTSAFTGLSGYLTNQSGAATKMCGPGESGYEPESAQASFSWSAQRRALEDDEDDAFNPTTRRPAPSSMMPNGPGSWSSVASTAASQASLKRKAVLPRQFVDKHSLPPPMATPVWQLDFSSTTSGGALFSL